MISTKSVFRTFLFVITLINQTGFAGYLTQEQIEKYNQDGYLVIQDFVPTSECDRLRERASELVAGFDPGSVSHIFTTENQEKSRDEYFLGSSDTIRFFFEKDAFSSNGALVHPKELAINKIGHNLHDLDPTFSHFSRNPDLAAIIKDLGVSNPLLWQSMFIFKQPHIGGEVGAHQDGTFLYTEPDSVIGFWFALEDATQENSCLWAIPGGHKEPLRAHFTRTEDGLGTRMKVYDKTPWDLSKMIPLEVPKGSLIILHSKVPHMSYANRSPKSRHAYTLHVIDETAHYPAENWLQRGKSHPARGF